MVLQRRGRARIVEQSETAPVPISDVLDNDTAAALYDAHVDDGTGHCAGCRLPQSGARIWPCTLRCAAARKLGRALYDIDTAVMQTPPVTGRSAYPARP